MGRRIFVDLNDQEEADIHGWVNRGRADPSFANYPTRLVLGQRDRARFDQIEAQFPDHAPPPPPIEVGDPNYGVPAGTFSAVGTDTPLRRDDDQARVRSIDPQMVLAVPLVVPDKPWNNTLLLSMGVSEYASPAGTPVMQACFSRLAGDFKYAMANTRSEGTSIFCLTNVAIEHLNPGDVFYLNMRLWSSDLGRVTSSVPHQVRIGGSWPR